MATDVEQRTKIIFKVLQKPTMIELVGRLDFTLHLMLLMVGKCFVIIFTRCSHSMHAHVVGFDVVGEVHV